MSADLHRDLSGHAVAREVPDSGAPEVVLNVSEEDARFMIVACSAVVHWLIANAELAGVLMTKK